MYEEIIQVSENPLKNSDYIDTSYYDEDHWFLKEVADYVAESNRGLDIRAFESCMVKYGFEFGKDEFGQYFTIADKVRYFKESYKAFKKHLASLQEVTLESFSEYNPATESSLFNLMYSYEDKFSIYIHDSTYAQENSILIPIDEFVRLSKPNKKYYIGGTLDYHR